MSGSPTLRLFGFYKHPSKFGVEKNKVKTVVTIREITQFSPQPNSSMFVYSTDARPSYHQELTKYVVTSDQVYSAPSDESRPLQHPDVGSNPSPLWYPSETEPSSNPKPCSMSVSDIDHTCSAVCADDPACMTYHGSMARTIATEMPSDQECRKDELTSSRNTDVRIDLVEYTDYLWNIGATERQNRYSLRSALQTVFRDATASVLSNVGMHSDICRSVDPDKSQMSGADVPVTTQETEPCPVIHRNVIPIYVPKANTISWVISAVMPTATSVVLGGAALDYLDEDARTGNVKTNPDEAQRGIPSKTSSKKQSTFSYQILECPEDSNDAPKSATNVVTAQKCKNKSAVALTSAEHANRMQSALRSLLLTTVVPVLGEMTVENIEAIKPTSKCSGTLEHVTDSLPSPVGCRQPATSSSALGSLILTTTVPTLGDEVDVSTRHQASKTESVPSSQLPPSTSPNLAEAVEGKCVDLTEIGGLSIMIDSRNGNFTVFLKNSKASHNFRFLLSGK